MTGPLFHGGKPGLKPGDLIEPGEPNYVDGCAICAAHKAGMEVGVGGHVIDPANHEPDQVFATTDREYGRFYASKYPRGDLYSVDLVGDVTESDKDPFPTLYAPAAIVRGTVDRCVVLTPHQRRRLLRRWKVADEELGKQAQALRKG